MAPKLTVQAAVRFDTLLADRGYDSNAIYAAIRAKCTELVIPIHAKP